MLKQSEIPLFRLPFLVRRVRREMGAELPNIAVASDLKETLEALVKADHQLMIMSSNTHQNIESFLRQHGINQFFGSVIGSVGLLSKARALRRIIQKGDIDFSQVIYVGDETRDVDASKQVGVLVAAVTWGFSSREALAAQDPAFLVDHPKQLLGAAQTLVNPSWVRKDYRSKRVGGRLEGSFKERSEIARPQQLFVSKPYAPDAYTETSSVTSPATSPAPSTLSKEIAKPDD